MGIVHPFHDFDNEAFAYEAVSRLVAKGRRRIALLGPPPGLTYHKHTHQGFERGLQSFGLSAVPLSSIDIDAPLWDVRNAARELAARSDPPDGIICSAVRSSFAVAAGFADQGLAIGRDFDIVTKHATDLLEMLRPEIIAIPEDFREAGRDTALMVMAWIAGADPAGLQRLVTPETS
jgi:LacI family transcriptional regulator